MVWQLHTTYVAVMVELYLDISLILKLYVQILIIIISINDMA